MQACHTVMASSIVGSADCSENIAKDQGEIMQK